MLGLACPLTKKDQLWTVLHYKCKYTGPCWGLCEGCSYFGTNDHPKTMRREMIEFTYMGHKIKIPGRIRYDT